MENNALQMFPFVDNGKYGKHNPFHISNITEEQRKHHSIINLGTKNPNWKGGISNNKYGLEFNNRLKQKIKKRDKYICQLCDLKEKDSKIPLCVHHIDYNKNNNEEYNLITLCRGCNGKVNSKRQNWIEFLQ